MSGMARLCSVLSLITYGLIILLAEYAICQGDLTAVLNCPDNICRRPSSPNSRFESVGLDEEPTLQNGSVLVQRTPVTFYEVGADPRTVVYEFNGVSFCVFTIEVSTECPALENCPSDIQIVPNQHIDTRDEVFVQWTEPIPAQGFTPSAVVSSLDLPQALVGYGETINVSYSFMDDGNREINCRFNVMVSDIDRDPPEVFCPGDIIVNASTVWPCVPIDWEEPTSDDLEAQRTTRSSAPGDCFNIGVTTVTYEMTDLAGNIGSCQFSITVQDITPPEVLYCPPSPLHYTLPLGTETVIVSWPEPKVKDVSGTVKVVPSHQSGVSLEAGSTNVAYTFTDGAGNEARCEFEVIVTESSEVNPELLIVTCPQPISITTAGSEESVTWDIPTTNQDGLTAEYVSHSPGSQFPIGVTRVTYIFIDSATGNSATCSFVVTVTDATPPVIESCPTPRNVVPDRSGRSARHEWAEPTATDSSGLVQRTVRTSAPGDTFSANPDRDVPYTISYVFSDPSGNIATCEFVLTVLAPEKVDAMLDIVNCPTDITAATPKFSNTVSVSWTEPRTTDPIASWDRTHAPGSYFPIGTTTVDYVFRDKDGNELTCSFDVVVEDTIPPVVINCPLGFDVTTSSSSVARFWDDPTSTDNSGEVPTPTAPSDEPLPVGETTTITYLFEDTSMNVAECSFQVNVRASSDNTPPEIEDCPGKMEVNVTTSDLATVTWTGPSTSESDVTVISNYKPGDPFPIGVTMVTYIFTDTEGNGNVCSFEVHVTDYTAPSVTCIDDVTFDISSLETEAHVYWLEPSATDNSGYVSAARSHAPGDIFTPGASMVSYTFTDPSGNSATCNFIVTVHVVPNTIPPEFLSCPADIYAEADSTSGVVSVSWETPLVEDDTDPAPTVTGSHAPSDTFTIGRTQVVYSATDSDDNMAAPCTFYVTVNDVTKPTFENCPSIINMRLDYGITGVAVSWEEPVAMDNGPSINIAASNAPGDIFFAGVNTVEYISTDQSGNSASCLFQIEVEPVIDREPPVVINCPEEPIQVEAPPTSDRTAVSWSDVNATDTLTKITVTSSRLSGSEFMIGQHQVNVRFTDQPGNLADCNFTVIVEDVTPPLVENCPGEVLKIINTGASSAPVTWTMPTVADNSGSHSVTENNMPSPGDEFDVGITPVVYVYSDNSSNTASCDIQVTLIDDSRPPNVRHCPRRGVLKSVPENTTETVVRWRTPTARDPDTNVTVTSTHQSGDVFSLGVEEVAYVFEDFSGNIAECIFNVTVTDEFLGTTTPQIPFMNCPLEVTLVSPPDGSCTVGTWEEPSNNSDIIVLQNQTHFPGETFCFGEPVEVTYTFYDFVYEELFRCSFMVAVNDVTPPEIMNCPEDIKTSKERDDDNFRVTWMRPNATDNSGEEDLLVRESQVPGSVFENGETAVSYTFRDSSGNSASCQFTVTVEDGTIVFGLVIMEVIAISAGAVLAIVVILICCCCCCICCCCMSDKDGADFKETPKTDQNSDTESQLNEEMDDPHRYWVLPASVRRVQRRVSTRVNRSFRMVREHYSDRRGRGRQAVEDEREMSELQVRDTSEENVPTLERKVIRIEDDPEDSYRV